jgi:hypothetical protein
MEKNIHPFSFGSSGSAANPFNIFFYLLLFFACDSMAQSKTFPTLRLGKTETFRNEMTGIASRTGKTRLVPLPDGQLEVTINVNQTADEKSMILGEVKGSNASNFFLTFYDDAVEGKIVMPAEKKSYRFYSDESGSVYVTEEDIHDAICVEMAVTPEVEEPEVLAPVAGSVAYTYESLKGAAAVIYLDFDGQNVTGTSWNGGNPINAAAVDFSESKITSIWKEVSEDYRPFNINVTTNEAVFLTAAKNRRMRVIFTTTTTAAPGSGGVAYINSFSNGNDNDAPCWVYNTGTQSAAATASHEVGHTLGLKHDGRTSPQEEYYGGNSIWGPIMGSGMTQSMVQWSKGEYANASNTEDDLAILTRTANGVTYRTDEAGNTRTAAKALVIESTGNVSSVNYGIITTRTDVDIYSFTTTGGSVTLRADPATYRPDLDVILSLTDASGNVIASANPTNTFYATVTATLAAGTYYLSVDGTGSGADATTGYSDYASVGEYILSGAVPVGKNALPVVQITAPLTDALFNAPAGFSISATATDPDGNISKVEFYNGASLLGSDQTNPYSFTWSNVAAGTYSITAKATDNAGAVTTSAIVKVMVNALPVIKIASPVANAVFTAPANVVINADAIDSDGNISKVEFYNGSVFLGADETSPYSYSWTNLAAGSYNFTAKATDNAGAVTTSAVVKITVNNALPVVAITSPANNSSFTAPAVIAINADASDANGTVSKVEFYNGSAFLGSDQTAPYSYSWTNVAAGIYNITARATDNSGAVTTSSIIKITVSAANKEPLVTILSPEANSVTSNSVINITGKASDPDGRIARVDFFDGELLIGTTSDSVFNFEWAHPEESSYQIIVKAYDNNGASAIYGPVTVNYIPLITGEVFASEQATTVIYPNPFRDSFSIRSGKNISEVRVINIYGEIISVLKDNKPAGEYGQGLPAGWYFVMIINEDGKNEIIEVLKAQ